MEISIRIYACVSFHVDSLTVGTYAGMLNQKGM